MDWSAIATRRAYLSLTLAAIGAIVLLAGICTTLIGEAHRRDAIPGWRTVVSVGIVLAIIGFLIGVAFAIVAMASLRDRSRAERWDEDGAARDPRDAVADAWLSPLRGGGMGPVIRPLGAAAAGPAQGVDGYARQPAPGEPEAAAYQAEPAIHAAESAVYQAEPVGYEAETPVYQPESAAYEPESAAYDAELVADEGEFADREQEPAAYEPEPVRYETGPGEHEPGPAAYAQEPFAEHVPAPATAFAAEPRTGFDPEQAAAFASEPDVAFADPEYQSEPVPAFADDYRPDGYQPGHYQPDAAFAEEPPGPEIWPSEQAEEDPARVSRWPEPAYSDGGWSLDGDEWVRDPADAPPLPGLPSPEIHHPVRPLTSPHVSGRHSTSDTGQFPAIRDTGPFPAVRNEQEHDAGRQQPPFDPGQFPAFLPSPVAPGDELALQAGEWQPAQRDEV